MVCIIDPILLLTLGSKTSNISTTPTTSTGRSRRTQLHPITPAPLFFSFLFIYLLHSIDYKLLSITAHFFSGMI